MKNKTLNLIKFFGNIRLFRFLISGGVAFGSNILFFSFFLFITNRALVSSILAFVFSVVISFLMQKFFTFRDSDKSNIKKQSFLYLILALLNLSLNSFLFISFLRLSNNPHLAQIASALIIAIWSFFVYRKFVFK